MFSVAQIDSSTGASLRLYHTHADHNAKGVVQINHGMAEHAARYERFALALSAAGYHVYAHDHRGHGHTLAPDAHLGYYGKTNGWDLVLQDVNAVNQHIQSQYPETPIICFGHSMGATIATAYAQTYPDTIQALAAWNGGEPGVLASVLRSLLKLEAILKGSDVPSDLASKLTFETFNDKVGTNRTDFDWLSRDEAEVDKYVADPLCGFQATIGLWRDFLKGLNESSSKIAIRQLSSALPIHLLGGDKDPCSGFGKAQNTFEAKFLAAKMTKVTRSILPDTRHESLNEINRDKTTADFIAWLNEQFG